jgi:uncharacterized protein
MAEQSTLQSGLPVDYYAPDYSIEVGGGPALDPTTKGDVLNVSVTMDHEDPTGFSLTINNWDDKKLKFKYSDSDIFEIGKPIHIKMGYAGKLLSMARGVITSMSPSFPESGSPTIGIIGADSSVRLRDIKPGPDDQKFEDMADWEIASKVAYRNHLKVKVTQEGEKHHLVVQKDQDELTFLKDRASRIDFECFMRVDPNTGDEVLHFIKPTDCRAGGAVRVYVFEWGKSLVSFNAVLSAADQVPSLSVRAWDPQTKSDFFYKAEIKDLPQTCATGINGPLAAMRLGRTETFKVVDRPVTSQQEAQVLAVSLLRERAYKYLTGSGQVIGLPDLRPGDNVELHGLGERFSGPPEKPFCYYVKKAVHTLGNSGYMTQFDVRAVCDGGNK